MKGNMKTTNKMTKAITGAGLVLLLAFAFTSTATAQNRIVFGKFGTGKSVGLYSINADGSGLVQLTQNTQKSYDKDPVWSPGQSYVAFERTTVSGQGKNVTYTYTLCVMEAKGELNGGRIFAVASGFEPDWSPDGAMILFRTLDYDIAVVAVNVTTGDVGAPVKLVTTALHEYRPTWSPDGTRIAFAREFGSCYAIYVHDLATGSEIQFPVVGDGCDNDPEWSPDGTRIAFDDGSNIYVANADGSNLTQVFNGGSCSTRFPTWSPDGTAIAFSSCGIKRMNLATGVVTTITSGTNPDWSP